MIETTPKVNINTKNEYGKTAEDYASSKKMRARLKKAEKVNVKEGWTLLMFAAFEGRLEIARFLIANGADVNAKNEYGMMALMYAAINGNVEVAELLIANGADVNAKDNYGMTALMYAAISDNVEVAKLLIANGADVNAEIGWAMSFASSITAMSFASSKEMRALLEKAKLQAVKRNVAQLLNNQIQH